MAAHARLSASKMKQAKACPASVRAQESYPRRESKAAKEGTAAHWMAEQALLTPDAVVEYFVGIEAPNGVTLTRAMATAVQVYLDEVLARAEGADLVHVEVALDGLKTVDPDAGGNADCVILHRGRRTLHVLDYKNGVGVVVDPTENEQALTYALGALLTLGISVADIDTVELVIVQPNAAGEPVKRWETDPVRLIEWAAEVQQIGDATRDPKAPRVAGEHCMFCAAKGDCDVHYKKALDAAGITEIDFYSDVIPKVEPADRLSPAELSKRLRQAEHLERWIRAVKEHAEQMAADGNPPDGFKLVNGRGSRVFRDAAGAFSRLSDALGFAEADFYTREPLSVAQVEKFIGKKALKNVDWPAMWESRPGRPVLAPVSDPRPEYNKENGFDVVSDFIAD